MRISVFTPSDDDQGEWDVDAYSIDGGALRLFDNSGHEIAAYSPSGWTHLRVVER
jgi:hypothetical protein